MNRKKQHGFLLLEALMSLSLLALGASAMAESFWIAQQWMERGRFSHQVAVCLDEQAWLAICNINMSPTSCPERTTVHVDAAPFSTSLVRMKLTVSAVEGGAAHESSVEGFRSAL